MAPIAAVSSCVRVFDSEDWSDGKSVSVHWLGTPRCALTGALSSADTARLISFALPYTSKAKRNPVDASVASEAVTDGGVLFSNAPAMRRTASHVSGSESFGRQHRA